MSNKNKNEVPPSLQPRKKAKKAIPKAESKKETSSASAIEKTKNVAQKPQNNALKEKKERFTLWLPEKVYLAFKMHVAKRKGSGSDYIESLLNKDLKDEINKLDSGN